MVTYEQTVFGRCFSIPRLRIPAGHNPETFRMYEAAEAGSIPVVPIDKTYRKHACADSLQPIIDSGAPFIFINDWSELAFHLRAHARDSKTYNRRAKDVRAWYVAYMRNTTRRVETLLETRWLERRLPLTL